MKRFFFLLCLLLPPIVAGQAVAAAHYGQVFFASVPVPGATVTVTQGEQSFSTVTDRQGVYEFNNLVEGEWKVTIEMRGFAPLVSTVKVAPEAPQGNWELKLQVVRAAGSSGRSPNELAPISRSPYDHFLHVSRTYAMLTQSATEQ